MRAGQMAQLDKLRTDTLNKAAITIQRYARGALARRRFVREQRAVVLLQAALRGWAVRKTVAALRRNKAATTIQVRAWAGLEQEQVARGSGEGGFEPA